MSTPHPLEQHIQTALKERGILLMSHIILGYPSLEENRKVIEAMVASGVDLMELQIPFSEPIADGPVIARANQSALDGGFKVEAGMQLIAEITAQHDIPFLIMTYTNILYAYGYEKFMQRASAAGIKGLIIPDLPFQEAGEVMRLCRQAGMAWVQLMTPTSTDERLAEIGTEAEGFVYCVARRGVTGANTEFDDTVGTFIKRCKKATAVPLAVGFGVKSPEDVAYLKDKSEVAVVGSAALAVHEKEGAAAVGDFFRNLRL
uniref:Tryptophan synthase alpha chain n=1 Tax=Magnetococcus massalia (strain MO-1) TaxID=451514 RepID=A0A1S7LP26_MAGMO|nr:Tryptophan synthase alpha chain [Candidatus Magnetococcus massalia]